MYKFSGVAISTLKKAIAAKTQIWFSAKFAQIWKTRNLLNPPPQAH